MFFKHLQGDMLFYLNPCAEHSWKNSHLNFLVFGDELSFEDGHLVAPLRLLLSEGRLHLFHLHPSLLKLKIILINSLTTNNKKLC